MRITNSNSVNVTILISKQFRHAISSNILLLVYSEIGWCSARHSANAHYLEMLYLFTAFHYAFPVHNLDIAKEFYADVLGCKEGRSSTKVRTYHSRACVKCTLVIDNRAVFFVVCYLYE